MSRGDLDLERLADLMRPGETVADAIERLGGIVEETPESPLEGIVDERSSVDRIMDAISDLASDIEATAEESELAELSATQDADLRRDIEYLSGAVETYIESVYVEPKSES